MSNKKWREFRRLVRQWSSTDYDARTRPIELDKFNGLITQGDFNKAANNTVRLDYGSLPRYKWRMTKGPKDYANKT